MTSTILRNPYAAILRAIWSIIIDVAQVAGNNLGKVRTYHTIPNHEYNTNSGAGNPLELLHPGCMDRGVGMENQTSNREGFVYLIVAEGTSRYKIGRTTNLANRIEALRQQGPYPLKVVSAFYTDDCVAQEARLHTLAFDYRRHGEWFELPPSWLKQLNQWFSNTECSIFPQPKHCSLRHTPVALITKGDKNRSLGLPPKLPETKENFDLAVALLANRRRERGNVSSKVKRKIINLLGAYPTSQEAETWKHNLKKIGFDVLVTGEEVSNE